MKILYFDCFSGISGDMTLGALLDLGIDRDLFRNELGRLNLPGYEIHIEDVVKNGIKGIDVTVEIREDKGEHAHQHGHNRHDHHSHCEKQHQEHSHTARNLGDIEALIDSSDLKTSVKEFSKKVFREIARAEARVHNKGIDEVHFHEVGAVDSIVDIVGAAICLDILGADKVYSSALHEGKGFIECQHGLLPVPVPAVMEMLKDGKIPVITEDINTELVTPTGLGIIKCLAEGFGNMPPMTIDGAGYGTGKRETGRFNALRVVMGTSCEESKNDEGIAVLETNIDDMSPEALGYAMEKLFEAGALDVFYTPVYMKKNRPAVMLTVISSKTDEERLAEVILKETSTLGVRSSKCKRYCMDRKIIKVNTPYGEVGVKTASRDGFRKFAPEYEDCREIAKRTGMPLKSVYEMVSKQFEES
ncbi:MAG: nickel pincer cofactor biosynthesis protein LarC [Clostridia bacterium]|nr:nickel pincer cofactor biosynthesis protein LarC [Clostridia bacterium]